MMCEMLRDLSLAVLTFYFRNRGNLLLLLPSTRVASLSAPLVHTDQPSRGNIGSKTYLWLVIIISVTVRSSLKHSTLGGAELDLIMD